MLNNLKKNLFRFITLQRRNWLGRRLLTTASTLRNALENKMEDSELNGEYWFLSQLDFDSSKLVFDVGANIGNWTKKLKEISPEVEVHLFEPVPETFELLKENTKNLLNILPNGVALSDIKGNILFNYYPGNSCFSSAFENELGKDSKQIEVDTILGDDYCLNHKIDHIDFLKIDTEGFESKVLLGFQQMISNQKIDIIQFEYGNMAIDSKFLLADFYQFFETRGYQVGKIFPIWIEFKSYSKEMENFVLSNFVAVRKGFKYNFLV